jgi:Phosphotransferase enzyme family
VNVDWRHADGAETCFPGALDPAFPQLAVLRDLPALRSQLGAPQASGPLRRPGLGTRGGELVDVWHVPGRELHAVYRLDGPDRLVRLTFARVGHPPPVDGTWLEPWRATAWTLPEDPQLPALMKMADPTAMAARLAELVGPCHDDVTVSDEVHLLGYLPGKRFTLRYGTSAGDVVAKVDRLVEPSVLANRHAAVAELAARSGTLRVSRPLGVDAALGARFETALDGDRPEARFSAIDFDDLATRVARAVAELHGLPLAGLTAHTPGAIVDRMRRKVLKRVAVVAPSLVDDADAVLARLECAPPPPGKATIHGDLHAANLLIGPAFDVALIDLDSIALGDPAWDLALFATRLVLIALVRGERVAGAVHVVANVRSSYEQAAGTTIDDATWAWYLAATLLGRQVKACVRHGGPRAVELAAVLLEGASAALDGRPLLAASRSGARCRTLGAS